MKFKNLVLISFLTAIFSFAVHAETQKIRYYPVGELTLCKGCGHSHSDYWRGNFRIENISEQDLILFGWYFEGKFLPSGMIQRRNPDLCEWQYGNGKNKDIEWSKKSSFDKETFILKSKQSIEVESGFNESEFNKAIRFTVYSASKSNEVPTEVFSDAFSVTAKPVRDELGEILNYEKPVFSSIDDSCDPNCKLSIEQSPNIKGIKLGMTLAAFKIKFPRARISKSHEKKYNIKRAWLWDYNEDAFDTSLTFLDDKIVEIETKFKSLENARDNGNLYLAVAEKLVLKDFWTPYSDTFECKDFLIDVLSNQNPTITIWNKTFIEVRDRINEEALRKK